MISHNPAGQGNPYRIDPDQRFPYLVELNTSFEIRFTTDWNCDSAVVEVAGPTGKQSIAGTNLGVAVPEERKDVPQPAPAPIVELSDDAGHLAEAAARAGEQANRRAWSVFVPSEFAVAGTSYRIFTEKEETISFEIHVCTWRFAPDAISLKGQLEHLDPESIEVFEDQHGTQHTIRFEMSLAVAERIVGFGERYNSLDLNGHFVDVRIYEQYKTQGERTYFPIPFGHFVNSKMGIWLETGCSSSFDFRVPGKAIVTIDVYGSNLEPVNVHIFKGEPAEIVEQFLERSGPAKLPPKWAYKLWLSSNEWNTQARVEQEVQRSIEEGHHPGVVVIEAWSDESTFQIFRDAKYAPKQGDEFWSLADFEFPKDGAWPDPKGMIDWLHANDIKLILWQIPVLHNRGTEGSQAEFDWDWFVDNQMAVLDGDSKPYRNRGFWFNDALLPDFTNPAVRAWWVERRKYLVTELGVDGFKTDGGEHLWGHDLRFADGTSGAQSNNLFPVLYAQAYHELGEKTGKDLATFSRAGFTGAAKYPLFWAGDENSTWEAFRASVRAGLTLAASGISFWGWDIAGFSGPLPSAELYIRSVQMATFCPIMQIHSEFNHHKTPHVDRTPWNIAEHTQSAEVMPLFKKYADVRNELTSYIEEQALHIQNGRPLMTPLFFDYPTDEKIWDYPLQYMFGTDLLVAPVTEAGIESIEIYLPEGNWKYLWDGKVIAGGQSTYINTRMEEIPVFYKSSSTRDWSKFLSTLKS